MTRGEKIAANRIDKRIDAVYRARCANIQISVMDIGKVFAVGRKAIAEGVNGDAELGDRIAAFVETIRKN
jgi:hypothetical protein